MPAPRRRWPQSHAGRLRTMRPPAGTLVPKELIAAAQKREIKFDLGATVTADGVRFRVWATRASRVDVVIESGDGGAFPLRDEGDGFFSADLAALEAGTLYRFRLDGCSLYPDPCSRYQPEGVHGPSMVMNPSAYLWRDSGWRGVQMKGQVLYELHVGAFTPEGTFDAAAEELAELSQLGITLVELMPLAEWAGRWNWGYDGVYPFAPFHGYGDPDALRRFVDAAHATGMGVILDVVYNHLGPEGNYLGAFSSEYFTDRYKTDWGAAINFDGSDAGPVRDYFVGNAAYWITEFHLDGLRLDATQSVYDEGSDHVIAEIARRAREAAGPRGIVITAENEPQETRLIRAPKEDGFGCDALWNDDFHHAARVALTGRREAYYTDYLGSPQEFVSLVKRGFLYQGQRYLWQDQPRGTAVTDEPASGFVVYIQNHDQLGNDIRGRRIQLECGLPRFRAMTALLLLAPETPLLFMGQEHAAETPFLFFVDHGEDLRDSIREGRAEFLAQFPSYDSFEARASLYDPCDPSAFENSKLDPEERRRHGPVWRLHRDLLKIRRNDPVIARQDRKLVDGAVLGPEAFVLRWTGGANGDRLLLVNLGRDLLCEPAPEPLLAPPARAAWFLEWSSDDPRYGGPGVTSPTSGGAWRFPSQSAQFLRSEPA